MKNQVVVWPWALACLPLLAACALGCGASSSDESMLPEAGASDAGPEASLDAPSESSAFSDAPSEGALQDAAACGQGFITEVVSTSYGTQAGFGQLQMPAVVYGPPKGSGSNLGSLDVVSLGLGGEIVVGFGWEGIKDGPGPDFIVFENAIFAGGDPASPFAEPGEVSVSADGQSWSTFPCAPDSYPYTGCAGWHPVYSNPNNDISPFDPEAAGGEAYDLSQLGLSSVRYVRIRDRSTQVLGGGAAGFDLDAIAVLHPACP